MLLDGGEVAGFIKQRHFEQMRSLQQEPHLAIVGHDSPYVRAKQRYGQDIGVRVSVHLPQAPTVAELSADAAVTGIIVQLPTPEEDELIELIAPLKDVDGLRGDSPYDPATPKGIMWLLGSYGIKVRGLTAVVVGQGRLVGEPLSFMFEDSGAEVVACDIDTPDLKRETLKADILVTATGQPQLIKPDMVKPGAVVVDCGSPKPEADSALLDEDVKITPVPGGVGPMTVAALFDNLMLAALKLNK